MSKTKSDPANPIGEVTIVNDFLPTPQELIFQIDLNKKIRGTKKKIKSGDR